VFVAASTHCFHNQSFDDACHRIVDLEYDKVELWFDEQSGQLKPSEVAADPEQFVSRYQETTRLTPVAISLEHDVDLPTFTGLSKLAKLLQVMQITVPASPLGTPFNSEIDRLRAFLRVAGQDGVRVSIKTKTGLLTEDPDTSVELCQSVPGLGLTLDPSYFICGPHHDQPFDRVYPHVYHVQLRDTTPEQLQVQIGLGVIDYSRLISKLRRVGYNRALSVELLPAGDADGDRALEMRKLRMLLDSLL